MTKPLAIGIIGSGRMGDRHAEAYKDIPGVKISGFVDFEGQRAETLAKKYSARVYQSVESMMQDSMIDAVSICTPNASHVTPAVMAAEAGKHILVEKPLATTVADCDTIIRATIKHKVKAMVGLTHRFYPSNVAAKKLLEDGSIGNIYVIQDHYLDPGFLAGGQVPDWMKTKESGGIMTDAVHFVDRISWWSGQKLESVHTSVLGKFRQESINDELVLATFRLSRGAHANLMMVSPSWGVRDNHTDIIGSEGVLYVKYGEEVRVGKKQWETHDFPFRSSPPSQRHNLAGFKAELEEFVECIAQDRDPVVTLQEGRLAIMAVLAISESYSRGISVSIKDES